MIDLLGTAFFKSVPKTPGVYIFYGEQRRVLYVGQSKNLRQRLSYYKNAQPEREPRRIIRMVHQTRALEYETCPSSSAAAGREVQLIQEHRPRFNVQHALSRTYSFIGVRAPSASQLRIRLSLEPKRDAEEHLIGAFKNRGLCRRAMFAAGRVLWCARHNISDIFSLPVCLLDRTRMNEVAVPAQSADLERVVNLLKGDSDEFLQRAVQNFETSLNPFLKVLFQTDLLSLTDFFALAVRMKALRHKSGSAELLSQNEVDRVRFMQPDMNSIHDESPASS